MPNLSSSIRKLRNDIHVYERDLLIPDRLGRLVYSVYGNCHQLRENTLVVNRRAWKSDAEHSWKKHGVAPATGRGRNAVDAKVTSIKSLLFKTERFRV